MKKTKLTRSLMAAVSVVALSAVMYGCVHSGSDPAEPDPPPPTPAVVDLMGSTDLMAGMTTIPAGMSRTVGNTTITCAAGGEDCVLTVMKDSVTGAYSATSTGGTVTVAVATPPPPPMDSDGDGIPDDMDPDDDNDGVPDAEDDLPLNPMETTDTDGDGVGDNADLDDDGDGVLDADDAFPLDGTETVDSDGDGIGDNADTDRDGDGVANAMDAFPDNPMESADLDMDGIGDNADPDRDGDGVANANDAFPDDAMETADADMDGIGDNADTDDDNDGVADADDAFPDDPMESADSDGDGIGDNADTDRDGDGVADAEDAFPDDPMESADLDMDGVGDNADTDIDGDGVANAMDAFPRDAMESVDLDMDGIGDNADTDDDGDGVADADDAFPRDAMESADLDGDGIGDNADTDRDGDGYANVVDEFPDDPMEWRDSDDDGVGNNADALPYNPDETADADGDGVGDNADAFDDDDTEWADADGDGYGDNEDDAFPDDPDEWADADGDGYGDNEDDAFPDDPDEWADADGDGTGDNADAFDDDPTETADSDMDGVGDNADPFPLPDDNPQLFRAANGAHVMDVETTEANETAMHVASVGAAMAVIADATDGAQAAGTTATITFPGDTVDNPATDDDEFSEGMLGITVSSIGGGGGPEIVAEFGADRAADTTVTPAVTQRIQTARQIADLGDFQGYELWEDDGDDTATSVGDRARAIVFTNKQKGDDSVLAQTVATARSVVGLEIPTAQAGELAKVTSTGTTITGVEWTPSGDTVPLVGTLSCSMNCSITLGADGAVTAIQGYSFTGSREAREARDAAAAAENNDFLYFGLWLEENDDGTTDTFGAFAGGGVNAAGAVAIANALTGTATYSGKAAGAHHRTGDGVNWFEGDASLMANFGADDAAGTISGSISNIQVNGGTAMSTPIYLGQANLGTGAATFNGDAFMGAPTAPGASTHEFDGTWSGSFFGATANDPDTADVNETETTAPLAAAGTFGVTKSTGTGDDLVRESFVGAFGADKD